MDNKTNKPTYEELEAQLRVAIAAERVWETIMMRVCGEDGPGSVADKFMQLAAESAALKTAVEGMNQELYGQGFEIAGWHLNGDLQSLDSWFEDNDWNPETPATDAFLSRLRNEAWNEFVDAAVAKMSESGSLTVGDCIVAVCQLREGKAGEVQS